MTAPLAIDVAWRFRSDQKRMSARMVRDLRRVWPALDFTRLDATYPVWASSVEQVVRHYEDDSIDRTRQYMETFYGREGITGRPAPYVLVPRAPQEKLDALLHSQAVAGIKKSTAMGSPLVQTLDRTFSTTSMSMVRVVRDRSREYVRQTSLTDDRLGGWQRIGTGDTCAFCQMLLSRGAVYSEKTVRFASHLNCACEVMPAYGDQAKPVEEYRRSDRRTNWLQRDDDSGKKQIAADRDRVARWLAANDVG